MHLGLSSYDPYWQSWSSVTTLNDKHFHAAKACFDCLRLTFIVREATSCITALINIPRTQIPMVVQGATRRRGVSEQECGDRMRQSNTLIDADWINVEEDHSWLVIGLAFRSPLCFPPRTASTEEHANYPATSHDLEGWLTTPNAWRVFHRPIFNNINTLQAYVLHYAGLWKLLDSIACCHLAGYLTWRTIWYRSSVAEFSSCCTVATCLVIRERFFKVYLWTPSSCSSRTRKSRRYHASWEEKQWVVSPRVRRVLGVSDRHAALVRSIAGCHVTFMYISLYMCVSVCVWLLPKRAR